VRLTPSERDRLLLFTAAELARARLRRGTLLNVPEATALVADTVVEAARDGARRSAAIDAGRSVLRADQVLPGVPFLVPEVWVEAGFDDGTRLVVVEDPFHAADGAADVAADVAGDLPRTALPATSSTASSTASPASAAATVAAPYVPAPGLVTVGDRTAAEPAWTDVVAVAVENTAAVPVAVTSHLHFFEANPALRFDRSAAYGRRLAVEAGTSLRFDAGAVREVGLVAIGGARVVIGVAGLVDGPLDAPGAREQALERAHACGYLDSGPGGPVEDGPVQDSRAGGRVEDSRPGGELSTRGRAGGAAAGAGT